MLFSVSPEQNMLIVFISLHTRSSIGHSLIFFSLPLHLTPAVRMWLMLLSTTLFQSTAGPHPNSLHATIAVAAASAADDESAVRGF